MKLIAATDVASALRKVLPRLACALPCDVEAALVRACDDETDARGRAALETLCVNAQLAAAEGLPLCQDTGTVRLALEIGPDVAVAGDVFSQVDDVVAEVYGEHGFRASVVADALFARTNTGANTPAFCEIETCAEPGCARMHVMLKGGGSDNASRVVMLPPSAGRAGVAQAVLSCVREKAANACPPLVVGVGVGGTFDSVAGLAAKALRREVGEPAADADVAAFEAELLREVNALGIGAAALGGAATALAVHVETAPCHIAALPVAIDLGCCALRRCTIDLSDSTARVLPLGTSAHSEFSSAMLETESAMTQTSLADVRPRHPRGEADDEACGHALAASSARAGQSSGLSVRAQDCLSKRGHARGLGEGFAEAKRLTLPLEKETLAELRAGDACLLTGELYTLRDAGHARLAEEIAGQGQDAPLPYGLDGATIFYAGPTPASPAHPERPFGAVGPTTASRMDAFAPALYAAGVAATIGKGSRSDEVARACAANGSVYFSAIGGAATLLGTCVKAAETIAYGDLGTEALRRLHVEDLPVTVAIDAHGAVFSPAPSGKTAAVQGNGGEA